MFYNYCSIVYVYVCFYHFNYAPFERFMILSCTLLWVEGVSLKAMAAAPAAALSTDHSLSPFSQSICYAWSHIYHMLVSRLHTINWVHINPLLLLLLLPPPPPPSPYCYRRNYHHFYYTHSVPLTTVQSLRTVGSLACPVFSFRRSFTGNMTETRTQNTNYVYIHI